MVTPIAQPRRVWIGDTLGGVQPPYGLPGMGYFSAGPPIVVAMRVEENEQEMSWSEFDDYQSIDGDGQ